MDRTEKQRAFIIHFLYFVIVAGLVLIFLKYVIYEIMPFLIGFAIAFLLQPLIRTLARKSGGHERLWAVLTVIVFYMTIGAGKIEEAADAAGRDRSDTLRQDLFIIHGVTTSRSPLCLRSSSRMMPLSLYCFRTNSVTVDFTASMQAILSATKLATSYMLLP